MDWLAHVGATEERVVRHQTLMTEWVVIEDRRPFPEKERDVALSFTEINAVYAE